MRFPKSLDFVGDSGRIITLRYEWTYHGVLVTEGSSP